MQSLFHFYSYLYFIIIFILMITKLTSLKNLTFYTKEHPNVNTLLGNIFTLNHILTINTIHSIQLKTFNVQLTKCFRLDRRTGDLYTTIIGKTMLDSEKICIKNKNSQIIIQQQQQSNLFSVKHLCSINLLVTINNRLLLSIIIQIEDINDNSPIFLDNNIQNYFINESSLPELTKIPLKPAYDIDFNGYNKLYYYLNVISNHELIHNDNPFRLIDTLKMNDTNDLYSLHLVLIKPLDYEIQSMYTLNLTVCDNPLDPMYTLSMDIIHCTSQLIYIHVNNVNDELPWFEQTNYSIIIYETLPIDSEILKVTAYDNDSTPYNRIHYHLIPSHDMILLNNKDLFHINSTTGVIKLAKTILKPVNTSIAYFKITDEDELHNAEITCQLTLLNNTMNTTSINNELLHLNTFQLIHINHLSDKTIINKLILSKNLDAEKLSENILLINKQQFINQYDENIIDYLGILLNCYDHGMPRLSTTLPIIIGIIDIDEYYPNIEFINSTLYETTHIESMESIHNLRIIELQEETLYTQPIGYVKALDYDQDKIDRELISIIDLLIGAHDLGEPKLTSFIKIRIKINDINDNSPEWQFPTDNDFIVIVSKSLTIGTIITRIHAIDKDESINNGYINYYFYTLNNNNNNTNMYKSSYNLITYQIITQFFALDTKSGELTVKYSLLALPDGFLDIWLQAIDNGNSDIHTNNHNHINFDNSHELINYYKQNKSTKDIIAQIHSLDNIHDILPLKMNTNLSSLYITNKKLYGTNINKLSLLISTSMIDKYIEHVPKDINNNEEKFTELNGSNLKSLSIDNTTNQTYIPMSLIGNSTELHYTPITSMMNLTDNIPLHLVHVANDTFSVPLCMTHDNIYATIEHNTTEQLTPQSLTIVATVVSTDQMKSNLLPILSEESSTTDVINAITNNKLCDDNTNIKLEYLTHSEAYYPTYTPCVLTTLANTS
ncbi:Protocadherin beta-13 [Schistosoma japonicum]|uniref:Protocadherin beta-13 n=1 Tax=Schistosoma japonicum TaxID=6182 RepID=A0A4Z2DDV5_SCHJA|nr:Protocadherin beta-13 [Schistosoma japonicum]